MRLLINEWFIHDLSGENGLEAQERSARFCIALVAKKDQLVILESSPWMAKAYKLMTKTGVRERAVSKLLQREILLNSELCLSLKLTDLKPIPDEVQALFDTGQVDRDDYYLLQIYHSTHVDFLVTSDKRLVAALSTMKEIRTRLKDDFLKEYLV